MTPKKFQTRFSAHKDAKEALSEYYGAFKNAAKNSSAANSDSLFSSEFGWTLGPAGPVARNKDMATTSSRFAKLVTKTLGARFGDENELAEIIEEEAHKAIKLGKSKNQYNTAVVQRIADGLAQDFEIFLPSQIVCLQNKIEPIRIGSVRILSLKDVEKGTQQIVQEMTQPNPNFELLYDHNDPKIEVSTHGMRIGIPSARMMWAVKAAVSKKHLREEALWRIGVAISLIRIRSANWDGRQPDLDQIEPNPTSTDPFAGNNALTRNGGNLSAGGQSTPCQYIIDTKVAKDLRKNSNQTLFDNIFNYEANTLAEQAFNALGWLARGRQANDRSERLFFFFTAIEAILTREDKNSPIIDTISRHGAVAIAKTIKDRPHVALRFKKLYGFRSATVHRGARNASALNVHEAHFLAELLVAVVLRKCDMAQKHAAFCDSLTKSSFGAKWSG